MSESAESHYPVQQTAVSNEYLPSIQVALDLAVICLLGNAVMAYGWGNGDVGVIIDEAADGVFQERWAWEDV